MIFRDYCDGLTNNGGLEQMSMTEDKLREAVRAAIQRLAEKSGKMPMKDEPEGKDLNKDGKKGHGKVPAFLKQEETEQVEEGEIPPQLKKHVEKAQAKKAEKEEKVDEASMADDPTAAEEAEAAERAAEGGEAETKVNEEEELEESPSHPASDRSQGRDTGRRVKDVNSGERKEVAESVDELKEWYLGTLSEALVKRFTK
jgi:hypothetical protein